jgi:hypothetical protein
MDRIGMERNKLDRIAPRILFAFFFLISVLAVSPTFAQQSNLTLSGTVSEGPFNVVANAKVSLRNLSTGQSAETRTDSAGRYSFANLAPGDYEVSASASGFETSTLRLALGGVAQQTAMLSLTRQTQVTPENLPNAPSPNPNSPSLEDLGFSPVESQADARKQALLDKRTRMLKIHQRMGLITTIPLVATVILGPGAGGKSEGTTTRDLHVALGALTGDLYGITAWYAIRAPRIEGTKKKGPIKFHEAMAWIHGPGMILTPILGALAFEQKNNGEKVHGIAQAHGPVAIVTAGAFGAALLSVSVKF